MAEIKFLFVRNFGKEFDLLSQFVNLQARIQEIDTKTALIFVETSSLSDLQIIEDWIRKNIKGWSLIKDNPFNLSLTF